MEPLGLTDSEMEQQSPPSEALNAVNYLFRPSWEGGAAEKAAARYLAGALGVDSPAVKAISGLTEAAERGGGPLFGIDGLAVVGHGRTKGEGSAASVALAKHCLEIDLVKHMREDLAAAQERAVISFNDNAADEREA